MLTFSLKKKTECHINRHGNKLYQNIKSNFIHGNKGTLLLTSNNSSFKKSLTFLFSLSIQSGQIQQENNFVCLGLCSLIPPFFRSLCPLCQRFNSNVDMYTWCKDNLNILRFGSRLHSYFSLGSSSMNGHLSEYELQRQKNIAENKKILASLGVDKFKVSVPAVTDSE